jgi:hypothetical protein
MLVVVPVAPLVDLCAAHLVSTPANVTILVNCNVRSESYIYCSKGHGPDKLSDEPKANGLTTLAPNRKEWSTHASRS